MSYREDDYAVCSVTGPSRKKGYAQLYLEEQESEAECITKRKRKEFNEKVMHVVVLAIITIVIIAASCTLPHIGAAALGMVLGFVMVGVLLSLFVNEKRKREHIKEMETEFELKEVENHSTTGQAWYRAGTQQTPYRAEKDGPIDLEQKSNAQTVNTPLT